MDSVNFFPLVMLEHRVTNQLVTRLPQALINPLVTRLPLSQQPLHMVQHLGTRPLLHPIQGTRQTAVQAAIKQHLPLNIRDIASNPRVVAIHRPAVDQATNSHRDMIRVEGISPVARGAMVVAKAVVEVTKVVGIKAVVVVAAAVVVAVDMDSRALPMAKAVVVMEEVEEGKFQIFIISPYCDYAFCHVEVSLDDHVHAVGQILKILIFTSQNLKLF